MLPVRSPEFLPVRMVLVRLLIDVSILIQEPVTLGVLPIGVDPPGELDGQKADENY